MLNLSCADLATAVTAWEMKIQMKMQKNLTPELHTTALILYIFLEVLV